MSDDMDDLDKLLGDLDDDFSSEPHGDFKSDDRKAVTKAVKGAASSAFSRILPKRKKQEIILKALPKNYGEAADNIQDIKYTADDLYSHTKEELLETKRQMKRKTQVLMPTLRKYLPTPISERVDKWSKPEDRGYRGEYDEEQAKIDSAMASVFNSTRESVVPTDTPQAKRARKQEGDEELQQRTEEEIKEFSSDQRQLQIVESTKRIERGVEAIVRQEQLVGTSWKRKTLEVNLRQMFALQEISALIKMQNDRNIPAMEAIVKNTALPDYAKEQFSEVAAAMMQRKIIESINPMEYSRNFLSRFADNAKKKVSETLGEVRSLMDLADTMADDTDFDSGDTEISEDQRKSNLRELTSNQLAAWIAERVAVPVRDKVLKRVRKAAEGNDKVVEFGEKLRYYSGNVAQIYNTELTDETEDSMLKTIVSYLEEIQSGYNGELTKLRERDESWLNESAKNDNRKYITITEIIPAWLARISGGIDRLNGGSGVEEEYDIQTRKFVKRSVISDRVRDVVGLQDKKDVLKQGLDGLVKLFDTNNELSEQGRKELRDYFYDRVRKNRTFDIKELAARPGMQRIVTEQSDDEFFNKRIQELAGDNLYTNMNKFASRFGALRGAAGGYQNAINQMSGLYGDKALVDAGIFTGDDKGRLKVDGSLFDLDKEYVGSSTKNDRAMSRFINGGVLDNKLSPKSLDRIKAINTEGGNWIKGIRSINQEKAKPKAKPTPKVEPKSQHKPQSVDDSTASNTENANYFKRISEGLAGLQKSINGIKTPKVEVKGLDNIKPPIDYTAKFDTIIDLLKRNAEGTEETKRSLLSMLKRKRKSDDVEDEEYAPGFFKRMILKRRARKLKEKEYVEKMAGKEEPSAFRQRFNSITGILRGGVNTGFDFLRSGKRGVEAFVKSAVGARDIYGKDGKVVLSGSKLEKGYYYTKVNEKLTQIFKLEDIKGAVYDSDGKVILSEEDLKNAGELSYYKDSRWYKLTEVIGGKLGGGVNAITGMFGKGGAPLRAVGDKIIAGVFGYPDIYVKGEKTPRLRAEFMRKGFYRLNGSDGPVVKGPSDIKGAVYDINNKLIISEEELASDGFELVDQDGNPVRTRFQRFNRMVSSQHRRVRKFIGGRITSIKNFLMGKKKEGEVGEEKEGFFSRQKRRLSSFWKGDGDKDDTEKRRGILSRIFGRAKDVAYGTSDEYNVLVKIYNLLNKRLPGEPEDELEEGKSHFGKAKSSIKDKVNDFKEKQAAKPERQRGVKNFFKRRAKLAELKAKRKMREVKETDTFKKARDKVEELNENTASKRRYARMKANKAKRGFMDRLSRGRRLTELKAKRAKRSYERDRTRLGETAAVLNAGKEEIYNPVKKFVVNNIQKAKRKMEEKFDKPQDKFAPMKGKGALKDPQLELLRRIADSSEAGWIKSIAESTDDYGMDQGFKRRAIGDFARKFKGGLSRFYRDYARKDTNDFGEEKGKGKEKGPKKEGKGKKEGGLLSKLLGGLTGGIGDLGDWIKGIIAAKMGGSLFGGGLKEGAKTLLKSGAKKVAGLVAGQGLRTAGAALLSGVGTVLGGLSLPVVAGVSAVGAIGWFAYRKLTRKEAGPLGRVRLAQYGVRDYDNWNSEDASKIRYLEDNLKRFVAITPSGATLKGLTPEKAGELAIGYGIDKENQLEVNAWHSWFQNRFIPIYLLWQGSINSVSPSLTVLDVEEKNLDAETQLKILNGVRLPPNHPIFADRADPLKADRGWFKSATDFLGFTEQNLLSGKEVGDVTARAIEELQGKAKREKKTEQDRINKEVGARKFNEGMMQNTKPSPMDSPKAQEALKNMYGGNKPTRNFFPGMDKAGAGNTEKVKVLVPSVEKQGIPATVEIIRFAMYGIDKPTDTTLEALRKLDKIAVDKINIKSGQIDDRFYGEAMTLAAGFGVVTWVSEINKLDRQQYKDWLRERYIPVFIAYNKAIGNSVGIGSVLNPMPSEDVYRAMKALVGTKVFASLGPVSVLTMPSGVNKVGTYTIIKDSAPIDKLIESIKPPEKRSMSSTVTDNVDKKVKKSYMDGLTYKERGDKNTSVIVRERQRQIAEANKLYDEYKTTTAQQSLAPRMDPAKMTSDLGTGQYAEFAKMPLKSREDVATLVGRIAKAQGVDPNLMITTALVESSLNPTAKAKTSSAAGLFQFINKTWDEVMRKHANRLGIPAGTRATDPVAATLLASEYFRENGKIISSKVNRELTPADYYMGHFLGAGGAGTFFSEMQRNPNAIAAEVLPSAAKANLNIFYDSSTGRARTLSEVYELFTNKFISRGSQIGSLTRGEFSSSSGVQIGLPSRAPIDDPLRREEAVVSKAKRDSEQSRRVRDGYRSVTPGGAEFELQSTAQAKEYVANQTEVVSKEQPSMKLSDKERYATALAEVESGVEPTKPKRENVLYDKWFKDNADYQSKDAVVQNNQLQAQLRIVEILQFISEKFDLALNNMGTKVPSDLNVAENTAAAQFSRQKIAVDLSQTKTNVARNKNA